MANPFTVHFKGKEHRVFVCSLENPKESPTQQYVIAIDKADNTFDATWLRSAAKPNDDKTSPIIDQELRTYVLDEMVKQSEFPYDFPSVNSSKFPLT